MRKLRVAFVVFGLSFLALAAWVWGVMMAVAQDLPALEDEARFKNAENSIVYADDGVTPLTTLTGNEARILVDSGDISSLLKSAVVAIEDERFYEHRGIDFMGIGRALYQDVIAGGASQGASTITQQFVKNAEEAQGNRTVLQKLREAALAYHIEREWTKDRILTNYLNNIYFGHGAYGIEMAARTYFGTAHPGCGVNRDATTGAPVVLVPCASVLAPHEAALLAAVISSPSAYDPVTNPVDATDQRNLVMQKMVEQQTLSQELYDSESKISVPGESAIKTPTSSVTSYAPFYTSWLRQQVADRYGSDAFGGGLKITSSLDFDLQAKVVEVINNYLPVGGPTAAVVVIDNDTAEVRAMYGGQDYSANQFNLATNGRRQPGSSFKPFTLIAGLEAGHTPEELFTSAPQDLSFDPDGKGPLKSEVFEVRNYGDSYAGTTTLSNAVTHSDNSVFVQLGLDVGTDKVIDVAERMGITSHTPKNPAIILGAPPKGYTPLEMAYAYSTLGNRGEKVSGTMAASGNGEGPVAIEKVTRDGDPVPDELGADGTNQRVTDEAISQGVADQTIELLHNVVIAGTGTRASGLTDYTWGKTGTTDSNIDAWFCGGVEDATACVWVGYNDPDQAIPMSTEFGGLPVDGGTLPAQIWHDVMYNYINIRNAAEAAG